MPKNTTVVSLALFFDTVTITVSKNKASVRILAILVRSSILHFAGAVNT